MNDCCKNRFKKLTKSFADSINLNTFVIGQTKVLFVVYLLSSFYIQQAVSLGKEAAYLVCLSPLRGQRALSSTPQSALLTAPLGSGGASSSRGNNNKAIRNPDGFWSGKRDLSPLRGQRALSSTPQSALLTAPLGSGGASSSRGNNNKAIRNPDGFWSGKRDLNSRPRPWQGRALPTELFPQTCYPQHCFGITKVVLFSFFANFFCKKVAKILKKSPKPQSKS